MEADAQRILAAGALLAAGVVASLLANRLRLPALVLFLGLGMLIGTDGLGWIDFENYQLARLIGSIALMLILFEAGLSTGFREFKTVLGPAVSMAVLATLITALVTGLAAAALFKLPLEEGLLLGAILSGTDGAAVLALLRSTPLPATLARTLEAESGLNDPIAILLVLVGINVITASSYRALDAANFIAEEVGIGALVGVGIGWIASRALKGRAPMPHGLYLVASLATAALAFGAAGALHGSGFLATYVAGLTLGSVELPDHHLLHAFHQGLATVGEIALFFALGLLVFPSRLGRVLIPGTALAAAVAFIARPLGAWLATSAWHRYTRAERLILAWAGLRGAVPVVLATLPVIERVPRSEEFFDIVFFVVLISTLLQGSTVGILARRLKVIR